MFPSQLQESHLKYYLLFMLRFLVKDKACCELFFVPFQFMYFSFQINNNFKSHLDLSEKALTNFHDYHLWYTDNRIETLELNIIDYEENERPECSPDS